MAWQQADSFHATLGATSTGGIADTYTDNAVRHTLTEVAGAYPAGGFDYEYWYELIPATVDWIRFIWNGFYFGNPSHIVEAYAWNYTSSSWVHIFNLPDSTTDYSLVSVDLSTVDYVSGGQAKVRILHLSKGLSGHLLEIDKLTIEDRDAFHTTEPPTTAVPTTTLTTAVPSTTAAPTTGAPTTVAPTTLAPTTVVTTTLAPTTTLTTSPPTTTLTTSPPSTAPPTTPVSETIIVDPINIVVSFNFTYNYQPPIPGGGDNEADWGPVELGTITVHGYMQNVGILTSPINISLSVIDGSPVLGRVITTTALNIVTTIHSFIQGLDIEYNKCNFVKWSKIGYLDFTIDESNLAGERPLDWKGCVWHLRKLGNHVVAYGENGVTILKASGVHWGIDTIYRIGLKNKGAFVGSDSVHFFVDNLGQFYQVDDKLTKLDYSEFLSSMGTIILSMDIEKKLVYICDGTSGYIYGIESKSFGQGPANVTGFGAQASNIYPVSYGAIVTPKFEICTDIYDLGTRNAKTIREIEVGTDITNFLYASVDYRTQYDEPFKQIGWFLVNPDGRAHPRCFGSEFRFRFKSTIYEYFELDYLKIKGHIHGWQGFTYVGGGMES